LEVAVVVDEVQETGIKTATWNSLSKRGRVAPSGVYYYRLQATNIHDASKSFVEVKKMILAK
jgi:hypothetical protein